SDVAQSSSVVSIDTPVIHGLLPWRPIDSDFNQMRNCNASPAKPVNWRKVHAARAGIVLRLNPACRDERTDNDKRALDRALFRAVEELVSARHAPRPEWLRKADAVEDAAQRLIKKEWDKSKKKARTGRLEE
ncbi:hypothetical protein U1737_08350, partial [Sphingomonas sp. LB3N6]|uniref:hypothetical protein n=1 Tax=Sphingomonas fucosidasi TaxID=3096164 RepID=UPI002FCAE76E